MALILVNCLIISEILQTSLMVLVLRLFLMVLTQIVWPQLSYLTSASQFLSCKVRIISTFRGWFRSWIWCIWSLLHCAWLQLLAIRFDIGYLAYTWECLGTWRSSLCEDTSSRVAQVSLTDQLLVLIAFPAIILQSSSLNYHCKRCLKTLHPSAHNLGYQLLFSVWHLKQGTPFCKWYEQHKPRTDTMLLANWVTLENFAIQVLGPYFSHL